MEGWPVLLVPLTLAEGAAEERLDPFIFGVPFVEAAFAFFSSSTSLALFSRASFSRWAFDRNLGCAVEHSQ